MAITISWKSVIKLGGGPGGFSPVEKDKARSAIREDTDEITKGK
jgi:hypothetical protein